MEEAAEQPWDYEQSRQRFLSGDKISLRELSELARVPYATVRRWAVSEDVRWTEQRAQIDTDVQQLARQKSIEAVSGLIAKSNETVIQEHLRLVGMLRDIASVFFDALVFKIKEIEKDLEPSAANDKVLEFLCSLGGRVPLQVYSSALHLAIEAERQALCLDLVDPAILEKAAAKHGLSLVNLSEGEVNGQRIYAL